MKKHVKNSVTSKTPNNEKPTTGAQSSGSGNSLHSRDTSRTESGNQETPDSNSSGNEPKKVDTIRLNVVHLLFLHGLLTKFYTTDGVDQKMKEFLHDLIIMFEVYIESGNPTEELLKHMNYQPLKIEEDGVQ